MRENNLNLKQNFRTANYAIQTSEHTFQIFIDWIGHGDIFLKVFFIKF